MDLRPGSNGRMVIALGCMAVVALSVWMTMEPGKYRTLTWILLAFFAARVVLGRAASR